PIDVILSRITVLQPDLVYIERDRLGIVTERAIEGAPTLVVEVLSPSTDARDRGVKLALYARYRVPFYWIVDPVGRSVEALRLSGRGEEDDEVGHDDLGFHRDLPRRRAEADHDLDRQVVVAASQLAEEVLCGGADALHLTIRIGHDVIVPVHARRRNGVKAGHAHARESGRRVGEQHRHAAQRGGLLTGKDDGEYTETQKSFSSHAVREIKPAPSRDDAVVGT